MKTLNTAFLLAFLLVGCATIKEGNDPIVVRAEQTIAGATDTFDFFLSTALANKSLLETKAPEVLKFGEYLAANGKNWIRSAQTMKQSYKTSRTESNKNALIMATAVLTTGLIEAQKYLTQAASVHN